MKENCEGKYIKVVAERDGTFTVTNGRTGVQKTYSRNIVAPPSPRLSEGASLQTAKARCLSDSRHGVPSLRLQSFSNYNLAPMIVIVMGVVGAGKTTVGRLLAEQLGWEFADADDFHPLFQCGKDSARHCARRRGPETLAGGSSPSHRPLDCRRCAMSCWHAPP